MGGKRRLQRFYVVTRREEFDWGPVEDGDLREFLIAVARKIWNGRWPRRPQSLDHVREGVYRVEEITLYGGCKAVHGEWFTKLVCDNKMDKREITLEVFVSDEPSRVVIRKPKYSLESWYRVYVL